MINKRTTKSYQIVAFGTKLKSEIELCTHIVDYIKNIFNSLNLLIDKIHQAKSISPFQSYLCKIALYHKH